MASLAACFSTDTTEEKFLSDKKITAAQSSPTINILAVGNALGTVSVYRYKITQTWELNLPGNGPVVCLSWRPDGKLLAVAYGSGLVRLLHYQDGLEIRRWKLDHVVALRWQASSVCVKSRSKSLSLSDYLPSVEKLNNVFRGEAQNLQTLQKFNTILNSHEEKLSILTVCTREAVFLYAGGMFPVFSLQTDQQLADDAALLWNRQTSRVLDALVSPKLDKFTVICHAKPAKSDRIDTQIDRHYFQFTIALDWAEDVQSDLHLLVNNSVTIQAHLFLLSRVMDRIKSFWEDSVSDVENKLTNYAKARLQKDSEWSLQAELMEILVFGNCPNEFFRFMKNDWEKDKIMRSGQSLLSTYRAMQLTCSQQLNYTFLCLLFLVNELTSLARFHQRCQPEKLDNPAILFNLPLDKLQTITHQIGTCMAKLHNLHVLIENGSAYLRSFFNFLLATLEDENEKKEIFPAISDIDYERTRVFIEEILRPIFDPDTGELINVRVEFVEQYLKAGGLHDVIDLPPITQGATEKHVLRQFIRLALGNTQDDPKKLASLAGLFRLDQTGKLSIDEVTLLDNPPDGFFPEAPKATLVDVVDRLNEIIPQALFDESLCVQQASSAPTSWSWQSLHEKQHRETKYEIPMRSCYIDNSLVNLWHDCQRIFLMREGQTVQIQMDRHAGDANPANLQYVIQDVHFYEDSDHPSEGSLILVLFTRVTDDASGTLQWFAMICVNWSSFQGQSSLKLSQLVTHENQLQPLNRQGVQLLVNSVKKSILVLFTNQFCQVFFLDAFQPDEDEENMDQF